MPILSGRDQATGMSPPIRSYILALFTLVLWPAPADAGSTVQIAKRDCQRLVAHLTDPGVAYVPGTDVRGRPVAPADLGGAPRRFVPETVIVDVDVDLQRRFGFPANADSYDVDVDVGKVEIAPDGTARFEGRLLQDEAQTELARRCQEVLNGRP